MQKIKTVNEVRLSGRTTREIAVKKVGLGDEPMTMAYFDIAQNYKNKGKQIVMYFHCVAWDKVAERLIGLPKGSEILIQKGFLSHSVYKKEGKTYNNIQIIISDFIIVNENTKAEEEMERELEQAEDITTY